MGLINYKDIDFNKSIDKTNKIISFNGSEIEIVSYLSTQDKYDLIMITLQKSFDNGIYNDLKLNMYFDLHLVFMYTNLVFDAEDRADPEGLYNILKQSGFIDIIKENIDEKEELWELLKLIEIKMCNYKGNLLAFLTEAIERLPDKAKTAMETLKQIDPELLKTFSSGPVATLLSGIMGTGLEE